MNIYIGRDSYEEFPDGHKSYKFEIEIILEKDESLKSNDLYGYIKAYEQHNKAIEQARKSLLIAWLDERIKFEFASAEDLLTHKNPVDDGESLKRKARGWAFREVKEHIESMITEKQKKSQDSVIFQKDGSVKIEIKDITNPDLPIILRQYFGSIFQKELWDEMLNGAKIKNTEADKDAKAEPKTKCENCHKPIKNIMGDWVHEETSEFCCRIGGESVPFIAEPQKASGKMCHGTIDFELPQTFTFSIGMKHFDAITCDKDGKFTISAGLAEAIKKKFYVLAELPLFWRSDNGNLVFTDEFSERIKKEVEKILYEAISTDH